MSELAGVALPWRPPVKTLRWLRLFRESRHGPVLVVLAAALVGFVAAFLALQPVRAVGELPTEDLSQNLAGCAQCQGSERIVAAGFREVSGGTSVTVRLGGPPVGGVLLLAFKGVAGRLEMSQQGGVWSATTTNPGVIPVSGYGIAARGQTLVIELPATLHPSGVQVFTGKDRFPGGAGYLSAAAPTHGLNIADIAVLILIIGGAWLGYRRGVVAELGRAVAVIAVLVMTFVFFAPIQQLLRSVVHNRRFADVLAYGLLLGILGCLAFLSGWYVQWRFGAPQLPPGWHATLPDKIAGAIARAARVLVVAAAAMALLLTLADVSTAAALIDHSLLGSAAAALWSRVFPVCVCA